LPSPLHVAFAPEGLHFCVLDPWRRQVKEQGVVPVAAAIEGAPWQPWVEALAGWLGERPAQKFDLHVVLFDGLVRYQLLPWRPGIVGATEWQAYAGHRFREVYGDLVSGWRILVAPTPPGEAAIVTAIDSALLAALRSLSAQPPRLVSLQPRFVAGFNHWRPKLKGESCWFATTEPGRVCLGLLHKGSWRTLRNESQAGLSAPALGELLHRLDLALDEKSKAAPVYISGHIGEQALPDCLAGHPVQRLPVPAAGRRQLAAARGF
jgi:hypothetical protein